MSNSNQHRTWNKGLSLRVVLPTRCGQPGSQREAGAGRGHTGSAKALNTWVGGRISGDSGLYLPGVEGTVKENVQTLSPFFVFFLG